MSFFSIKATAEHLVKNTVYDKPVCQ